MNEQTSNPNHESFGYRRNNSHISVCNRLMVERVIPNIIKMYNAGKFGNDYLFFENKEYYRNVFDSVLSKSISDEFITGFKIERGVQHDKPNLYIVSLTIPHNNEIGDTVIIGIIIDKFKNKAAAYCLEKSIKEYAICLWDNNKHFNFGFASNKKHFFSQIVALAEEDLKSFDCQNKAADFKSSDDYSSFQQKNNIKKSKDRKPKWATISIYCGVLLFIVLIGYSIWNIVDSSPSDMASNASSDSGFYVDTVDEIDNVQEELIQDDESHEVEESQEMDEIEDLLGETFVYNPKSGSIQTSSGRIISKGVPSDRNHSELHKTPSKKSRQESERNPYENVEISHFMTGEYPYANVYGKGRFDSSSLSKLSMSNKTSTDAVVLLCDAKGDVIRNVFVKKGSRFEIKNIPSSRCIIKVMFGNDWYKKKDNGTGFPKGGFTKDVSFIISKWSDAFDFIPHYLNDGIDYPTYEITLHAVPNGNFQTNNSSKSEFFNNN